MTKKAWTDLTQPWLLNMPEQICAPQGCLEVAIQAIWDGWVCEIMILSNEVKRLLNENAC